MKANGNGRGEHLHAIVLAAGRGERLRSFAASVAGSPLPKQFCDFGRGRPLLRETIDRLVPEIPAEDVLVVVDASQVSLAEAAVGTGANVRIVAQPRDRGTAAGVLLPLMHVLESAPEATVLITPCDHGVRDEVLFHDGIGRARRAVWSGEAEVVLLAAEALAPNPDYGWIVPGEEFAPGLYGVTGFEEKPPPERAGALWSAGALWNTMVVLARGRSLWKHYRRLLPELATVFEIAMILAPEERRSYLRDRYERLEARDFCRDVLARAHGLHAVRWRSDVGWTDLGTPERVRAWLEQAALPRARPSGAEAQWSRKTT